MVHNILFWLGIVVGIYTGEKKCKSWCDLAAGIFETAVCLGGALLAKYYFGY